jgi:hypothetical protein
MTSDSLVGVDEGAAQTVPAPLSAATRLTASPPRATEHARMDEDFDLLSDREVIRLFTTGQRPIRARIWLRQLRRPASD